MTLFSPAAVAEKTGFNAECIRRWCRTYPGFGVRIGGRWRVKQDTLDLVLAGIPLEDLPVGFDTPKCVSVPLNIITDVMDIPLTTNAGQIDGRTLRKTGRTEQLATRVTPEFKKRIYDIAEREGIMIVEVLERAADALEL